MSNAANPYAPPSAKVEDVGTNSEAQASRKAHIGHEASIKSVGILYYLGGILLGAAGVFSLFATPRAADGPSNALLALVFLVVAAGELVAGWGLRALQPWGRIVGIILSVLGLLGFPIGTLISAYILYLLLSKKGRTIFSPEYQDVIAATPHVKYKTSILVWIFIALVLAFIVIAVGVAVIGGKGAPPPPAPWAASPPVR